MLIQLSVAFPQEYTKPHYLIKPQKQNSKAKNYYLLNSCCCSKKNGRKHKKQKIQTEKCKNSNTNPQKKLQGVAWVPKGFGRFALQSARLIQNGRNLSNENIQQLTFNGHCNESNNQSKQNKLKILRGRNNQRPFPSSVIDAQAAYSKRNHSTGYFQEHSGTPCPLLADRRRVGGYPQVLSFVFAVDAMIMVSSILLKLPPRHFLGSLVPQSQV